MLHVRFLCAAPTRGAQTPAGVQRRRLRAAGKKLLRQGVERVVMPRDAPQDALPEGLSPEKTAIHGMIAHFYRFPENTARYGQEGYLLAFYEGGAPLYSVVLPELSTALVWIDEDTGAVFLLTGGLEEDILVRIAESMYETGGETA